MNCFFVYDLQSNDCYPSKWCRLFAFDYDMAVSEQYGIVGQPETIIIDEAGIVIEHIVGPISGGELANKMRNYLAFN